MLTTSDHFSKSQTLTPDSRRKWPAVFFLLDFTFVCPVEIAPSSRGGAR